MKRKRNPVGNRLNHNQPKNQPKKRHFIYQQKRIINKKEYYVYKAILYIIDNCRVIEEDSGSITVEIDLLEHDHLLKDITGKFFTKKIKTRKLERKIVHGYVVGNPLIMNRGNKSAS